MARPGLRPPARLTWRAWAPDAPLLAFSALAILTALMGGSARGDVQSLMVLRPVAALLLGYGLVMLQAGDLRRYRVPLLFGAAVVVLPLLQLVPLPFGLWSQLPGREQIAEIDRVAGLYPIARPLSLVPEATINALFSLLIPAAALILAIRLDRAGLDRLLPLCAALAMVSALLGILQLLGDHGGARYLYEITNPSAAVGLFANRNHQAALLAIAIPLLGCWGARFGPYGGMRRLTAFAGVVVLIPLILITGSRSGLIAAAVGLVATIALLPQWMKPGEGDSGWIGQAGRRTRIAGWIAVVAVPLGLGLLTVLTGPAEAWERLRLVFETDDLRFRALPTMLGMASKYWPAGTGMGSFERVYQANEPDRLLSPVFLNHAHNDWLELLITGGVPAVLLLIFALGLTLHAALRSLLGRNRDPGAAQHSQLGLIIIVLVGIVSFSDYPLRTPLLQVFFVVAVVWAACPATLNRPMAEADKQLTLGRIGQKQGRRNAE